MRRILSLMPLMFLLLHQDLAADEKPNVIYLMLDEWGYFESGHMGHPELLTPNIDRFASEGMRFTNAYAGASVCGPTRCVLMTGLHSGHTSMRVNDGFSPIRADEPTPEPPRNSRNKATAFIAMFYNRPRLDRVSCFDFSFPC